MDDGAPGNDDGRLIRGRRKKAILGLAAGALLVAGFLAAPRVDEKAPTAVAPAEPAAPLMQAVTQRDPFRGVRVLQETGRSAVPYTATLVPSSLPREPGRVDNGSSGPPVPLPAVAIAPATLLANLRPLGDSPSLAFAIYGTDAEAVIERCDPETGLALLRVSPADEIVPAPLVTDDVAVGEAGVGVARVAGVLSFDPVLLAGSEEGRVRLTFARLAAGTPVFDTEGRLAVIAGPDGGGWTIGHALRRLDGLARPIPTTLGVSLQPVAGPSRAGPGVVITDVETGGAADSAGLRPGDVLVSVDERPVSRAEDLAGFLRAGREARVRIRRGKQELDIAVTPPAVCATRRP